MPVLSPPQARGSAAIAADRPSGSVPGTRPVSGRRSAGWLDGLLRRGVLSRLDGLEDGRIVLEEGNRQRAFGAGGPSGLAATVEVRDPRFYRRLALGGSLGAAEAFIRGYWECDDLVNLVRIFCRNPGVSAGVDRGLTRLAWPLFRIAHKLRRNTTRGSRRNIAAHYDLGNEFFARFLDETMTYSCGIFERPDSSLEEASTAKYDRICRKLALGPEDHVLEIGCGWGGFALHAAGRYGCRVTATTISRQQYEWARRRVREAGLEDRVTLLMEDYRRLRGTFDKLVSIEMIEAVGHEYFDTYFRACCNLLKPEGTMLLQAITIPDQRYDAYRQSVDFIQRYVFPGGLLPSIGVICESLGRASDFRPVHLEDITPHYAETLRHWRERFHRNLGEIRRMGLPEELLRIWEYYFCYCEGGFRERAIGTVQMLLTRPEWRGTLAL
jgi:cyclopropane-fatty-acyl-phospholipid synthase